MNKVELLAPAGNLEKAKIALIYGSDAVYIGGKSFSLRARASNFDISDIKQLCEFASSLNKKVYVTMNIIPHEDDLSNLDSYLYDLNECKVTGIITSSLFIIKRAYEIVPYIERHVSTQMSIYNSEAIKFYEMFKVKRVVLSRETTIDEIKLIRSKTNIELEVFIHGGMCSGFSGRCVLSNRLTLRDANRGGCAHSCRWNYKLYRNSIPLCKKDEFFNIGSKDLCAVDYIEQLINLNVASLKIEGRMKSTYYIACVIRSYRTLIDKIYSKGFITKEELDKVKVEIKKAENRNTSIGFYNGLPTINEQLYDTRSEEPTKEYVAYVLDYDKLNNQVLIEQRNNFKEGDLLEHFGPNKPNTTFVCPPLYSFDTKEYLDVARHPLQKIVFDTNIVMDKDDMIRKVK